MKAAIANHACGDAGQQQSHRRRFGNFGNAEVIDVGISGNITVAGEVLSNVRQRDGGLLADVAGPVFVSHDRVCIEVGHFEIDFAFAGVVSHLDSIPDIIGCTG